MELIEIASALWRYLETKLTDSSAKVVAVCFSLDQAAPYRRCESTAGSEGIEASVVNPSGQRVAFDCVSCIRHRFEKDLIVGVIVHEAGRN